MIQVKIEDAAFPSDEYGSVGMSLRDYFAGQAMQGQLSHFNCGKDPKYIAHWSYKYADAMLAERQKERA
jgi:hypothetical protein